MTHQRTARTPLALWMFSGFLALSSATTTQAQNAEPFQFLREYVGLKEDQIAAIRNGKSLAKILATANIAPCQKHGDT